MKDILFFQVSTVVVTRRSLHGRFETRMAYNIILLGANLDPHEVASVTIAGLYACREKIKQIKKARTETLQYFSDDTIFRWHLKQSGFEA